jgi:hypothetical protein
MNRYIDAPCCLCDNKNAINFYIGYTVFILLTFCCWFIIFNFDISGTNTSVINFVFSAFFTFLISFPARYICLLNYNPDYLLSDSDDDDRTGYYDIDLNH